MYTSSPTLLKRSGVGVFSGLLLFSIEGINSYIKTFFHGTREMSTQVSIYTNVLCALSIYGCQSDVLIFVAVLTIVCISRMHLSTKFNDLLFSSEETTH